MSNWISVDERYPERNQRVWYFFENKALEVRVLARGKFYGFEPCYDKCVHHKNLQQGLSDESYTSRIFAKRWKPPCVIREDCGGVDYFGGERGVLGGDVTHWMPDTGQDKPERPKD